MPDDPGAFETFSADESVMLYVHREVPREGREPETIRFAFGLLGQCRVTLL